MNYMHILNFKIGKRNSLMESPLVDILGNVKEMKLKRSKRY